MSRIGKNPIKIPENVELKQEKNLIKIIGKNISFEHLLEKNLTIKIKENKVYLLTTNVKKDFKKFYGLNRSLLANKILGAAEPFKKILIAKGVGYKFQVEGKKIIINAGYSHAIEFLASQNIKVEIESPTKLILSSSNKEELGLLASNIRKTRPPEPYKGKGIMYENEKIIKKIGKSGKK